MSSIVLIALNAKFIHTSFGLRYLLANLGELRDATVLREFTVQERAANIVETILRDQPTLVGIGVYIWNATLVGEVLALIARVAPEVTTVIGGPEVSFEFETNPLVPMADYVIPGEADTAFPELARALLAGKPPQPGVQPASMPDLAHLRLPYGEYTDADVLHRVVYVEASRGCPFRCEFCLSSLDERVRTFPLAPFLESLAELHDRGVRHFKFVDRTFNLDIVRSSAILEFFAARVTADLFLHFELIPDRLPMKLRSVIAGFPRGCLQFEVGIQTFDDDVSNRIARRQDVAKLEANLRWLDESTGAHVHADLIVGLPGESIESFGRGFDRLRELGVDEIQVGILKRLRGTPIGRHDREWSMVYEPMPPYQVLATGAIPFAEMQEMTRFARYWDIVANSGQYECVLAEILTGRPVFATFRGLAASLYERFARAHSIAAPKLALALFEAAVAAGRPTEVVAAALIEDHLRGGRLQLPEFLRGFLSHSQRREIARRRTGDGNPAARRQRARSGAAGLGTGSADTGSADMGSADMGSAGVGSAAAENA